MRTSTIAVAFGTLLCAPLIAALPASTGYVNHDDKTWKKMNSGARNFANTHGYAFPSNPRNRHDIKKWWEEKVEYGILDDTETEMVLDLLHEPLYSQGTYELCESTHAVDCHTVPIVEVAEHWSRDSRKGQKMHDLAIVDAFKFFVDTHSSGGKINSQILTQEPYQNIRKHFEKVYIPELAVHH